MRAGISLFIVIATVCVAEARAPAVKSVKSAESTESTAPAVRFSRSSDPSERILGAAMLRRRAYERLQYLSDYIGPRFSGTAGLTRAVSWAADELKHAGVPVVRLEPVMVPRWVRGEESAVLLAPVRRELHLLGLGDSVGTGPDGIEAEVIVVDSFDALERLGRERVAGRIVLYDVPMRPELGPFEAYGKAFIYRWKGAAAAAKLGARAALVRSLATRSLRSPHTGGMRYEEGVAQIPAAALSVEDAALLRRFSDRGETMRLRLVMGAHMLADVESANVIAEIPGRERPDEIVLVGGHIDSWDVGDGATDDGTGVVGAMEVVNLLHDLGLQPRRTVRCVLFTNEENGMRGARDYHARHGKEVHFAGIESDHGADRPIGFKVEGSAEAIEIVRGLSGPLVALGAGQIVAGGSGVDISPLVEDGMPGLGLMPDPTHYFDLHHSHADTFDKIRPENIARQVAALTLMTWALAETVEVMPRTPAVNP